MLKGVIKNSKNLNRKCLKIKIKQVLTTKKRGTLLRALTAPWLRALLLAPRAKGAYRKVMADWKERAEIDGDVVFFNYEEISSYSELKEVFIWDLDKTYLDTSIDSLSGLFQTIMERAFAKKNIPGTNILIQRLSRFQRELKQESYSPIVFITASPPQMEEKIYEKFQIDGLRPMGCFYKDNLRNLVPKRFWRLRKQIGYKIQALMQLRLLLPANIRQICWGDDSESDAIIYNLYSDICSRRMGVHDIRSTLEKLLVPGEQIDHILEMQMQIPENDPVEKIYINLATDTDPDYYLKFGRRTLATYNTFQVALDLLQDQRLALEDILHISQEMIFNYKFTPEELMSSFDELIRRNVLGISVFEMAKHYFVEKGLMPSDFKTSVEPVREKRVENGIVYELEGVHEPWVQDHIDYLHDYR